VLLQDDLSGADALSCELLAAILASLQPTALVTANRGELEDPDSAAAAAVARLSATAGSTRTCSLGALDAAAVGALCAAELDILPAGMPAGLVQGLAALSGGHPLIVKELVLMLLWQGHLTLKEGPGGVTTAVCDVTRLDELAALGPAGSDGMARLEVMVQRRVDSLSPAALCALKAAAVLGVTFDLPLLARACAGDVTLADARGLAAMLVDEGMWVHVHAPPISGGAQSSKYRFAHAVVQALVYASMPANQRAELHNRVLRCLEAQESAEGSSDGSSATAPALQLAERARHARGANLHAKATSLFLASARASATGVAAERRVPDASRFAKEGLTSLRAATEQKKMTSCLADADAKPATSLTNVRRSSSGASFDALRHELMAVLDTVRRVQASWALMEPAMGTHGVALMQDFFRRCPEAWSLFSFGDLALDDPVAEPKMRKHAITLLSTVGTCVAGLRDFESMIPTLVNVGKMHYKFGPNIRLFFPPMGESLIATLRTVLGADFTADVEAAWQAMYDVITLHIFEGIEKAERAAAEESRLRAQLMGDGDSDAAALFGP
jgi:hemoglobin-like flavoprotein